MHCKTNGLWEHISIQNILHELGIRIWNKQVQIPSLEAHWVTSGQSCTFYLTNLRVTILRIKWWWGERYCKPLLFPTGEKRGSINK